MQPLRGFTFSDGVFEPDQEHIVECSSLYSYPRQPGNSISNSEAAELHLLAKLEHILATVAHFVPLYASSRFWANVEQLLVSGGRPMHSGHEDGGDLAFLVLSLCRARADYKRDPDNVPAFRGLPWLADKINRGITRIGLGECILEPGQSWETLIREWRSKQPPPMEKATDKVWPFWLSDTSDPTRPRETPATADTFTTTAEAPAGLGKTDAMKKTRSPPPSDENGLGEYTRPARAVAASFGPKRETDRISPDESTYPQKRVGSRSGGLKRKRAQSSCDNGRDGNTRQKRATSARDAQSDAMTVPWMDIDTMCDSITEVFRGHLKGGLELLQRGQCPRDALVPQDTRQLLDQEPDEFYRNMVQITGKLTAVMKAKAEEMGPEEAGSASKEAIVDLSSCLELGLKLAGKQQ